MEVRATKIKEKNTGGFSMFFTVIGSIFSMSLGVAFGSGGGESYRLTSVWSVSGLSQTLKSWSLTDLAHFKRYTSREKDPVTGKVIRWEGALLSQILDSALQSLPVESRAQVDLVVLKGKSGEKALIPRALVGKYPLLLAYQWGGELRDGRGPVYSVIPWSSKPKILKEDLPLENYFIPSIAHVELTNYRDQFGSLYLKRRTDPAAMRGEKLFVQNCASCHQAGSKPGVIRDQSVQKFGVEGHPPIRVSFHLSERDRQSIIQYIQAHRLENTSGGTKSAALVK